MTSKGAVPRINTLLTDYADLILGRQGIPIRDRGINVISLVVEGSTDQINALTGKIGKLDGAEVKSVLTKFKENSNDHP